MASSKSTQSPAFSLYASDFLGSSKVARMSLTEIGMYMLLLCHSWESRGLPTSLTEMGKLARMNPRRFEKIWRNGVLSECFIEKNGRMVNVRQEQIRKKQIEYREKQSVNGKKGGRPLKPKETQPKANPKAKKSFPSPSPLSSTQNLKEQGSESGQAITRFLSVYEELFAALFGHKPEIVRGRDHKITKDVIAKRGEAEADRLLRAFFASPDKFIRDSGYGLNIFAGQINKLLTSDRLVPLAATGTEGRGRTGAPPKGKYDGIEISDETEGL